MVKVVFKELTRRTAKDLFSNLLDHKEKDNGTYTYGKYHIRISGLLRLRNYNAYMKQWRDKNKGKYNATRRTVHKQRIRDGLCTRCGKVNSSPSHLKCVECRGVFVNH